MTCKDTNNIHIRFPRIGLEIRPYTVDFRIDRTEFDYLNAKFSKEVGDYLEPYTQNENAALRPPQPAEVVMDGEVSHWLYFRPQWVTYGETNCWIELHDPQKHLEYSVVDYKTDGLTVEEVYRKIIDEANTNDIINGIEFDIPENAESHVPEETLSGPGGMPLMGPFMEPESFLDAGNRVVDLWRDYDEEPDYRPSQKITESKYKFDLRNKNALESIHTINNELGLESWMTHEGILKVGRQIVDHTTHVASSNDSRVWRYSDVELMPPSTPIRMVVVNGGMIDAPNDTKEEDRLESVAEFLWPTTDHEDDLIAQGVAQRPDVLDGKIVSIDAPELSRDALEARAYQVLASEMMNNNSGTVEINPDTSGTEITDWRNVNVGDFLQLIPAEDEECKDIDRQVVLISGIRHNVDGGSWNIKLNIQKWANPATQTTLRYFSPDSTNYYNEDFEEIYTNDDR
ncbi:hypothetical protein BRC82_02385 [Halobacteriales archaeon QS_1_67_19]|nr:MAG: hypothetical protein BRC82_02385 [Halobacteriales archaeon QS_1_67_19]